MFFETPLDQRQSKRRAVDRHGKLGQQEGHRADVIFMAVREDEGTDVRSVLLEIVEIGRNNIDAQQLRIRKHHPRVQDDDVFPVPDRHGVHAELA